VLWSDWPVCISRALSAEAGGFETRPYKSPDLRAVSRELQFPTSNRQTPMSCCSLDPCTLGPMF